MRTKLDEPREYGEDQGSTSFSVQGTIVNEQPIPSRQQDARERYRQEAHAQLRAGQFAQASASFLLLLDHDGQDEDALLGMAQVLDGLNRFEQLYDITERVLENNPACAAGLAYKARALQKLQRISEAKIANDQALLLDTNFGLAWMNRSGLQLLQGKFPEALRSVQRARELAPHDARVWANYGVALFNFNRLAEALEAFDRSLELDGEQVFALQMKGEILCRIGRMREVLLLVQRGLAINPVDTTLLTLGVQALRTLEMYDALKDLTQKLLELTPGNAFAWENYVRSLRGLGQYAEANVAFDRLLELVPDDIRFWTMKADTLYRLDRYREAVGIAERARRLSPDYPPAQRIHEKALRLMYQRKEKKRT